MLRYLEPAHNTTCRVFLLLLIIARTDRPRIIPTMIDSHEKPGIGANVIGVEVELEVEVDIVLPTVPSDVLIDVVAVELDVVVRVESVELLTLVTTDVLDVLDVELPTLELLVAVELLEDVVEIVAELVVEVVEIVVYEMAYAAAARTNSFVLSE